MRINNEFISLRFSLSSNQFIYFQSFCFAWLQSFFQLDSTWNRSEVNPTNYPIIIKWAFPISFLSLPYGLLWSQNCLQAKSVYHIFKHQLIDCSVKILLWCCMYAEYYQHLVNKISLMKKCNILVYTVDCFNM